MKVKVADGLTINNFNFDTNKLFNNNKKEEYFKKYMKTSTMFNNEKPESSMKRSTTCTITTQTTISNTPTANKIFTSKHYPIFIKKENDLGEGIYLTNTNIFNKNKNHSNTNPIVSNTNSTNIPSVKSIQSIKQHVSSYYLNTETPSRNKFQVTSRSNNTNTSKFEITNTIFNTVSSSPQPITLHKLKVARKLIHKTQEDGDMPINFANRDTPFKTQSLSRNKMTPRSLFSSNYDNLEDHFPSVNKFDNYKKTVTIDNRKYYNEILSAKKKRELKISREDDLKFYNINNNAKPPHFNHVLYSKGNNLISKILKRDRKIESENIILK